MCKSDVKLIGKTAIVTGANTGIGFETAKDLAKRGAKVILACRDEAKATQACQKIIEETGNKQVIFKKLDLSSLSSVRTFCDDIIKTEPKLDILINNAGIGKLTNTKTSDGLVIEMQTNHFGPFLLTNLLLPLLKSSAPSRIVNVSSIMHYFGKLDLERLHEEARSSTEHQRLYANAKLCNILFSLELSQRLAKTKVTVNSLHPGAVQTDIYRNRSLVLRVFLNILMRTMFKDALEGAQTSIYLAVDPELSEVTGKYFSDCAEVSPTKTAQDAVLAKKLWEVSEKLVKLE